MNFLKLKKLDNINLYVNLDDYNAHNNGILQRTIADVLNYFMFVPIIQFPIKILNVQALMMNKSFFLLTLR